MDNWYLVDLIWLLIKWKVNRKILAFPSAAVLVWLTLNSVFHDQGNSLSWQIKPHWPVSKGEHPRDCYSPISPGLFIRACHISTWCSPFLILQKGFLFACSLDSHLLLTCFFSADDHLSKNQAKYRSSINFFKSFSSLPLESIQYLCCSFRA